MKKKETVDMPMGTEWVLSKEGSCPNPRTLLPLQDHLSGLFVMSCHGLKIHLHISSRNTPKRLHVWHMGLIRCEAFKIQRVFQRLKINYYY